MGTTWPQHRYFNCITQRTRKVNRKTNQNSIINVVNPFYRGSSRLLFLASNSKSCRKIIAHFQSLLNTSTAFSQRIAIQITATIQIPGTSCNTTKAFLPTTSRRVFQRGRRRRRRRGLRVNSHLPPPSPTLPPKPVTKTTATATKTRKTSKKRIPPQRIIFRRREHARGGRIFSIFQKTKALRQKMMPLLLPLLPMLSMIVKFPLSPILGLYPSTAMVAALLPQRQRKATTLQEQQQERRHSNTTTWATMAKKTITSNTKCAQPFRRHQHNHNHHRRHHVLLLSFLTTALEILTMNLRDITLLVVRKELTLLLQGAIRSNLGVIRRRRKGMMMHCSCGQWRGCLFVRAKVRQLVSILSLPQLRGKTVTLHQQQQQQQQKQPLLPQLEKRKTVLHAAKTMPPATRVSSLRALIKRVSFKSELISIRRTVLLWLMEAVHCANASQIPAKNQNRQNVAKTQLHYLRQHSIITSNAIRMVPLRSGYNHQIAHRPVIPHRPCYCNQLNQGQSQQHYHDYLPTNNIAATKNEDVQQKVNSTTIHNNNNNNNERRNSTISTARNATKENGLNAAPTPTPTPTTTPTPFTLTAASTPTFRQSQDYSPRRHQSMPIEDSAENLARMRPVHSQMSRGSPVLFFHLLSSLIYCHYYMQAALAMCMLMCSQATVFFRENVLKADELDVWRLEVASDFDATELKGGPNPHPFPWIPVVAYLESLPRPTKSPKCDQTFVSRVGGPQNGTFSAPLIHNPRNHSRQCLYIFLAGPGQRVEVVFTTFNLRGSPPDGSAVGELPTCVHEYMDIYSEVQSSDPADLINSPFGGRFCGTIPPRRRISMHRAIAISFFTNKNVSEPDLFEGHYRFLNASEYEIGIPIAGSPCSYTITPSMSINKTGALISPTYPGAYPKDMSCTYQFLGETNQRVRLEFRDFDLFFGGPHCPFDYVKVYDGPDNSSALIGTYCGQQRNLVLYSSESSLFVHFYTLPRTANTQNRGFKGIYEFSESFVKLDFIRENDGIHIRGSECDQKILSKKESTGFVLSPNYPYPYIPKTVCRYFIYGMQDAQHLERVRLEFSAFNIPKVENKDKSETNCSDGYLKIYLKGQETADAYDKFDHELCGNETQRVVSDGPRLAMVFSSGELQGRGFKGKYTFETEYKIPGTAAPDGTCSFTYVSSSKKRGELNSPRYPSNYPSETNCSYLFLAEPNEQVTIVFDHFKVKADNVNSTAGAYGASACFEDWLEMYVIYRDNNDRFLGRYCGLTAPGPVESPRGAVGLRITLHTDQENVASGFKARYYFEAAKSEVGDCGGNFSNEDSGIITSPLYPSNYKSPPKGLASMACNWYMTARPGYKLSINFEHFSVEGDPMARGCPAAVLRMWTNVDSEAAPIELCGEKPPTEHWHYMTTGQSARISFTTTDKTIGAQGFRIVWTEIQDSGPGPPAIGLLCESPYHFQCSIGYCISDKLRCDGTKNCGPGDDSDEMHCITEAPKEDHGVLIMVSMAAVSFLICLLCTLCHRQKKRRHRQLGLHRNTGHYDSTTSATGLSSSRRHLQSGGSLSGSLHGINSGTLIIPPAPLPPTSVPPPPHICLAGAGAMGGLGMGGIGSGMMIGVGLDDDDDNDDDEDNPDIFINDIRFDENNLDQLETV